MVKVNENFIKLPGSYLFSEVARKVGEFQSAHPEADIIRLGIGDVTRGIPDVCVKAMKYAAEELNKVKTFKGYGPEQGYNFVIDKIVEGEYHKRGIDIASDEIFLSDGSKSDTGNIGDILGLDNIVMVTDPVYPVYVDTNVMSGRAGELGTDGMWTRIMYNPTTMENNFKPTLPGEDEVPDVIYLCYPNNPTGTTLTRSELKKWVDYALEHKALILFDGAYEAYITEDDVPHSIYEIDGAKKVAIEFRSFSKNAGFTGVRCAYTVIPREVKAYTSKGEAVELRKLWNRRHTTKFNGVSYVTQRAAEAVYSEEGQCQVRALVDYYMENARMIAKNLTEIGIRFVGGVNSPYIWLKTPARMSSWEFFDVLLKEANVVGTPGVGFGPSGEGYFRLTSFNTHERTMEAMKRIKSNIKP